MDVRHRVVFGICVFALAVDVAAQEAPAAMSVAVEKGRISCDIRTAPLSQVLTALAERTGVTFVPADTIRGDDITLEMTNVPLEAGLRRLLRRYDTFMSYGASENSPSLRTVWIYPKGLGAALQPVAQDSLGAADIRQRVTDPDPRVREEAYAALISRDDETSRELLTYALRGAEADEGLREQLLTEIINQAVKLPSDLLTDLTRTDTSELIRLRALDALVDDPAGVDAAAAAAAGDPSPMVRERAEQILAAHAATNRRPQE